MPGHARRQFVGQIGLRSIGPGEVGYAGALAAARANALKLGWEGYVPPRPAFTGTRVFDGWDLAELARYIDWTPFFQSWELPGRYPAILESASVGETARSLFADGKAMLQEIIAEKWLTAHALFGLYLGMAWRRGRRGAFLLRRRFGNAAVADPDGGAVDITTPPGISGADHRQAPGNDRVNHLLARHRRD